MRTLYWRLRRQFSRDRERAGDGPVLVTHIWRKGVDGSKVFGRWPNGHIGLIWLPSHWPRRGDEITVIGQWQQSTDGWLFNVDPQSGIAIGNDSGMTLRRLKDWGEADEQYPR